MHKYLRAIVSLLAIFVADEASNNAIAEGINIVTCRGIWTTGDSHPYYFEWNGKDIIAYVMVESESKQRPLPVGVTKIDDSGKIRFGTQHYTVTIEHTPQIGEAVDLIFSGIDLTALVGEKISPGTARFTCE